MSQCEQLSAVRDLLPAKLWVLQILCGGSRTEETAFSREVGQSGGWRGGGMLFVGTWVPRELYRTRDQKVTVTSADNAPSQGQQPVDHTGCAVGHQDGVIEPVRKPRQQREICLGLGSGVTPFLPYLVVVKSFFFKRKNSSRCYSRLPGIVWQQD